MISAKLKDLINNKIYLFSFSMKVKEFMQEKEFMKEFMKIWQDQPISSLVYLMFLLEDCFDADFIHHFLSDISSKFCKQYFEHIQRSEKAFFEKFRFLTFNN